MDAFTRHWPDVRVENVFLVTGNGLTTIRHWEHLRKARWYKKATGKLRQLPSTSSLMTAAGFASQRYLDISWVIFFATLGNVLADNIAYWVTRRYGYSIFSRIGFQKVVDSPVFASLPGRIEQHALAIIFLVASKSSRQSP